MEGRHVDVMEMDAASRTGVGDIREIIDSVQYRAASARYKIYIIDEVHMLSTSAFNALLKTLEEPPAHVKFIFATTEIRKVPVTVLSRCQRYDLRRIEPEVMIALMRKIATAENAEINEDALALITRAAEGSVRDATSLLDQAISHGAGETTADQVRAMLGLADRGRVLDLMDMILRGDAAGALTELGAQYAEGADPLAVLRDLAEITHWVSVVKITPDAAEDPTVSPDERARGQHMAEALAMRVLTRMWQMLLKALEEVAAAPNAMMAAEMAVIRLTHVADLPSPEELIRKLQDTPPPPPNGGGPGGGMATTGYSAGGSGTGRSGPMQGMGAPAAGGGAPDGAPMASGGAPHGAPVAQGGNGTATALAPETLQALARYPSFEHVVDLIRQRRDGLLLEYVKTYLRLVSYQPGRIAIQPTADAPKDLAARLGQQLQNWTQARWIISLENDGGGDTITELENAAENALRAKASEHPLVQAVLESFPKAKITRIRTAQELAAEVEAEALPEVEDEWDPFEED
jgi:DNA polymerase-3 subunit gamma/tau